MQKGGVRVVATETTGSKTLKAKSAIRQLTESVIPKRAAAAFSLLFLLAFALSLPSSAQTGAAISGQAITPTGTPAYNAQITVCPYTATGIPCAPQATIYADPALTQPITQPYATDAYGNYYLWVASNQSYLIQIKVNQTLVYSYYWTAGGGSPGSSFYVQVNGVNLKASGYANLINSPTVTVVNTSLGNIQLNVVGNSCPPSGGVGGTFIYDNGDGTCAEGYIDYGVTNLNTLTASAQNITLDAEVPGVGNVIDLIASGEDGIIGCTDSSLYVNCPTSGNGNISFDSGLNFDVNAEQAVNINAGTAMNLSSTGPTNVSPAGFTVDDTSTGAYGIQLNEFASSGDIELSNQGTGNISEDSAGGISLADSSAGGIEIDESSSGPISLAANAITLFTLADTDLTLNGEEVCTASNGACPGLTSPLADKGDIWGFSSVNARIPIGADGTVLVADSSQTLGLKWAGSILTNPMSAIGQTLYGGASGVITAGAANITTNTLCWTETGTGSAGQAPAWGACSGSAATALSAITAASASNTITNGNNGLQLWEWAPTSNQISMGLEESSAATGGTLGNQTLLALKTLAGSTEVPLQITSSLNSAQTLPTLYITPTWNTTGKVDAALLINVTNTASGAGSLLLDAQVGGTTEFSVDKSGNIVGNAAAGTLIGTTLASNVVTSSLTALGTIATGVWHGTPITVPYGGTGVATITGPIKGNGTSAFSAADAADIYGLWSGSCSSSTYLNGAGACSTPAGAGTLTDITVGNLVPLFTSSVATPTSTPAVTFTLSNFAQNATFIGPASGGPGPPTARALVAADIPTVSLAINLAGGALGSAPYQTATNGTGFLASPTVTGTYVYAWQPSGSLIAPAALNLGTYLASPPAIGETTPAAGTFTTVNGHTLVANTTATVAGSTTVHLNAKNLQPTFSMIGLSSSCTLQFLPAADYSAVSGWGTTGGLTIFAWPTTNTVNWYVINSTGLDITTSGPITFNVSAQC